MKPTSTAALQIGVNFLGFLGPEGLTYSPFSWLGAPWVCSLCNSLRSKENAWFA